MFGCVGNPTVSGIRHSLEREISTATVVAALTPALRQMDRSSGVCQSTTISRFRPRSSATSSRGRPKRPRIVRRNRTWADFVSAFGCDAVATDEVIQDTALRTMKRCRAQHFLKTMRDLVQLTTADHLRRRFFNPWRYEDDKPNLRWDPADDRATALRWNEPSGDPIRTARGNRLAVEALPLLPTMPVRMSRSSICRLETTGVHGKGSTAIPSGPGRFGHPRFALD